mmetsp:Transcript_5172/g.15771  ORF Transcript_5172/g.15771 Transcript_5172/m.15771 type:complete len:222 (+) Transcript_5172:1150-1815(+)
MHFHAALDLPMPSTAAAHSLGRCLLRPSSTMSRVTCAYFTRSSLVRSFPFADSVYFRTSLALPKTPGTASKLPSSPRAPRAQRRWWTPSLLLSAASTSTHNVDARLIPFPFLGAARRPWARCRSRKLCEPFRSRRSLPIRQIAKCPKKWLEPLTKRPTSFRPSLPTRNGLLDLLRAMSACGPTNRATIGRTGLPLSGSGGEMKEHSKCAILIPRKDLFVLV